MYVLGKVSQTFQKSEKSTVWFCAGKLLVTVSLGIKPRLSTAIFFWPTAKPIAKNTIATIKNWMKKLKKGLTVTFFCKAIFKVYFFETYLCAKGKSATYLAR